MTDINETGGSFAQGKGGGVVAENQTITVDPDKWVTTLFRALENYVNTNVDIDIYDIRFGFPSAKDLGQLMPLDKTLIHFEIDDIANPVFGFGPNIVATDYDDETGMVTNHEVLCHTINWDIGIWASDRSGGVTARLEGYQIINDLFCGASTYLYIQDTAAIEIMSLSGGTFIKEEINDVDVFRVANIMLITRVYSRKTQVPLPFIGEISIDPLLFTEDLTLIVDP